MSKLDKCEICKKPITKTQPGVFVAPTSGYYSISNGLLLNGEGMTKTKMVLAHTACAEGVFK